MYDFVCAILFNQFSAWWIIACLFVGFSYALLFYKNNLKQKNSLFYILFALRALLISFLCFLLLSPLIQFQQKRIEKPLIIIAQDNSASIKIAPAKDFNFNNYHQNLNRLKESFKDHDVAVLTFGDGVSKDFKTDYTHQKTDVSALFSYVKEQFYGKNIGAVILASDGIFNQGTIPTNLALQNKTPIYTIALGDTIPKKDLLIANVNYNKLVYLGNDHTISIDLAAYQSIGANTTLNINTSDGQKISKNLNINEQEWKEKLNFRIATKKKGIQSINLSVSPINGEISKKNNQQTIYVDVIDGREKVLILANAPHPDIKVLKQSLDINKNYESEILLADQAPKDFSKYGLIIFHNLPSNQYPVTEILKNTSSKSRWFIMGTETNVNLLNQNQQQVHLNPSSNSQEHYGSLNNNFNNFSLSEDIRSFFQQIAPLNSAVDKINLKTSGNILLRKKNTEDALLAFTEQNSIKTTFLAGEGLWRWRIENFKRLDNHQSFDDFIGKTIQYLSVREDKRKLRVYPSKSRFSDLENVLLNAELYNDAYEAVTDAEIGIDIKHSSDKNYSFLFSKKETFYELNAGFLPEGEYSFLAKTNYGGKKLESSGNFIVEKTNQELQQTTANHQILYNLSDGSGAEMVYPDNISSLTDFINQNEKIKTVSYQDKSYEELINIKWFFFLLILILSIEWFLRKRNGVI